MKTNPLYLIPLLLITVIFSTSSCAQEQPQNTSISRDSLITAAAEIMKNVRYCALITVDDSGGVHTRAMDAFPPENGLVVWFATNPHSRKVAQIRSNPNVVLYYFDAAGGEYVSISATARIVDDAAEKQQYWKEEWAAFYPDRDENYLLIETKPVKMEIVSEARGIIGDAETWEPQTVYFE
ncbi:MAG: pyridoxamine 5'-phosphate oxidase family protein [Calditrichae bacterium]|nr:pyridoxamine 5'-phosphate oxidase family protein [Calditrichia bacterium]